MFNTSNCTIRPLRGLFGASRRFSQVVKPLEDNFGRRHDYLRVSLTERCNLRCKYCMPEEGIKLTKQDDCLQQNELERLATIFIESCGVRKVRLTGGEPTIDKKLLPFMKHLKGLRNSGLETIAMTTNGLGLKRNALAYKELGLNGLNISLDTLREDRFEQITRRRGLKLVHEGLKGALEVGFDSIKLNCVVIKGFNDDELVDFATLALEYPIEVRFIEFMPFAGNKWKLDSMITYKQMLECIQSRFVTLKRLDGNDNSATSKVFKTPEMNGSIGFISSITKNFCSGCNRLRLTSDGNLKVCLFDRGETSLRDLMRKGATDEKIIDVIRDSLRAKKKEHADTLESMTGPTDVQSSRLHSTSKFSHLNSKGEARMINVNNKPIQRRVAIARGEILVGELVLSKIEQHSIEKGDVITVSKVAGIMGAKQTGNLIPMCHQIPLNCVDIDIKPDRDTKSLVVTAKVEASHKTGVEMESLMAVSITLLSLYDMTKSVGKSMILSNIKLMSKVKDGSQDTQ